MGLRNWTNMTTEEKFAMLGNFYEDKREYDKALKCFGKAGNDSEILEKRGEYYYFGKGVEKNISYAKRYFKLAADAGNTEGMYNYACCEKDNEKSIEGHWDHSPVTHRACPYRSHNIWLYQYTLV